MMADKAKHDTQNMRALTLSELERLNSAFELLSGQDWRTDDPVVRQVLVFIAITQPFEQKHTFDAITPMFKQYDATSVRKCLSEIKKLSRR